MFAGVPDESLCLPEAVRPALPAEPDQRPVFGQSILCGLCDELPVNFKVLLVVPDMGINQLFQLRKDVHIRVLSHTHHSNPISCFFAFAGAFFSGCVLAAALS